MWRPCARGCATVYTHECAICEEYLCWGCLDLTDVSRSSGLVRRPKDRKCVGCQRYICKNCLTETHFGVSGFLGECLKCQEARETEHHIEDEESAEFS